MDYVANAIDAGADVIAAQGAEAGVRFFENLGTSGLQALVQIIDNAARYSDDAAPIRVTAHTDEQAVLISVQDCGAGLTADEVRR
jgi:light-regulated signal transduction histidine kinase (bacteriophytochrome)